MTIRQFDELIALALTFLEDDCRRHPEKYQKSGEDFEPCVKAAVDYAVDTMHLEEHVDYKPGGHGFPDIVIEGLDGGRYGIEVKSSSGKGNSWRINGNSVLGSTRVPRIIKNMIIFGKMRGSDSVFRAKDYEKCIANVVVTHSPRYLIDLDLEDGENFFDKSNLSYEEISESDQPIKMITDYFLSAGQTAWWLAESTPAAIQMFAKIPKIQQKKLIGYAFVHFPEIFSNSSTKFYRYMSWLVSENSIVDPALRDRFTASGRADVPLRDVVYPSLPRIFVNLHKYRDAVLEELQNADLDVLENDWGIAPEENFDKRVQQWVSTVVSQISNQHLEHVRKDQMIEAIIFDTEE